MTLKQEWVPGSVGGSKEKRKLCLRWEKEDCSLWCKEWLDWFIYIIEPHPVEWSGNGDLICPGLQSLVTVTKQKEQIVVDGNTAVAQSARISAVFQYLDYSGVSH